MIKYHNKKVPVNLGSLCPYAAVSGSGVPSGALRVSHWDSFSDSTVTGYLKTVKLCRTAKVLSFYVENLNFTDFSLYYMIFACFLGEIH